MNEKLEEKDKHIEQIDKDSSETVAEQGLSKKFIIKFAIIGSIIAALLAVAVQLVIVPMFMNQKAKETLKNISLMRGDITLVNSDITTYKGQSITNANINQKALAHGKTSSATAVFIFSNKNAKPSKEINIYVDFGSQRSRDFLLINKSILKSFATSGDVTVKVHPVPTGDAFSTYTAEAIAEAAYSQPDRAWDFMIDLMMTGTSLKATEKNQVLEAIVKDAQENDIKEIDKASIQNGTFASWLLTTGDDPKLQTGFYPPIVYINQDLLDPKKVNLNDPDAIKMEVSKR